MLCVTETPTVRAWDQASSGQRVVCSDMPFAALQAADSSASSNGES